MNAGRLMASGRYESSATFQLAEWTKEVRQDVTGSS